MSYSEHMKGRYAKIKADKGLLLYLAWRVWMWVLMLPDEVRFRVQMLRVNRDSM